AGRIGGSDRNNPGLFATAKDSPGLPGANGRASHRISPGDRAAAQSRRRSFLQGSLNRIPAARCILRIAAATLRTEVAASTGTAENSYRASLALLIRRQKREKNLFLLGRRGLFLLLTTSQNEVVI